MDISKLNCRELRKLRDLAKTARDHLRLNDLVPLCAAVLKPLNTTACSDVSALLFHADETPPLPFFTDQKPKKINRKF
jgi:hypothetical protein